MVYRQPLVRVKVILNDWLRLMMIGLKFLIVATRGKIYSRSEAM